MTAYNVVNRTLLDPGDPDDITVVLANFDAIAAVINGNLDNSNINAAAAIALSKLQGYPADNTKFARGDGTWAVPPTPSVSIPLVTAMPGSPADGDEIILTDSLTAPAYLWHLRYVSGVADAYKWVYIGGTPIESQVVANETLTGDNTYRALTTAGPSVILPRQGWYDVEIGGTGHGTSGANFLYMSYDIGATGAVDADRVELSQIAGDDGSHSRHQRKLFTAAVPLTLLAKYKASGANPNVELRWMRLTPHRVS